MTILKSNYWFDRTDKVLGRVAVNKEGKCVQLRKKKDRHKFHYMKNEMLTKGNNGENSAFAILCSCDLIQNGGNVKLTTRVK